MCVHSLLRLPPHTRHWQRDEKDLVQVQSGTEQGVTLGTPIGLFVKNEDQRPKDYSETDFYPRPSHADYTYLEKYGIKASSGGGRSSARETIGKSDLPSCVRSLQVACTGRVAAGAIAEKYLKLVYGIEIVAFVSSVGKIHLPCNVSSPSMTPDGDEDNDDVEDALSPEFRQLLATITREEVDKNPTRCPHSETAERMTKVGLTHQWFWSPLPNLPSWPFPRWDSASSVPKKPKIPSGVQ